MSKRKRQLPERPSEAFLAGAWGRVQDASAYSGCSVTTLLREIRRRRLSAFRIGGRRVLVLRRQHVDAWLEQQAVAVPVSREASNASR